MPQPETGGVRITDSESDKLKTLSDDEEITILSQDRADVRNIDIRDEQSENTQREDWLLPTELLPTEPMHEVSPASDWWGAPSSNRRSSIQECGGNFRRPASEWDPSSVARKADFYGRGSFHTSEGGGGRPAPEPQGVQIEARAVPKIFPEDTV